MFLNIIQLGGHKTVSRLFGTDGVRGVANRELTADLAYKLGQAGAYVLAAETKHNPRILVGMDTRISGDMLEAALVAGICSVGAEAVCTGVIPTPAVAYLTGFYEADAGVVISASHNPFEFNGIKFFDSRGYKLQDAVEDRIESILKKGELLPRPVGEGIGRKSVVNTALEDYVRFLKSTINTDLKGIKVAVDCANGAACKAAPQVMQRLGAEVFVINDRPDGLNINKDCGSTHMSAIKQLTVEKGADIGFAFDGDADRVLAVDEKGELIDGDRIIAITALHMKRQGKLYKNTVVATVMSNLGLELMARSEGIDIVKTKVGDRYVLEEMLDKGYTIGGEQSGHVIFQEYSTTGDGLVTALQLLKAMRSGGKRLSELAEVMQPLPQVLKNAKVKNDNKYKYMEDEIIAKMCRELEQDFHGEGRVLIRPSGTEPLIRVMLEGKDQEYITARAGQLARVIEDRLG